MAPLPPNSTPRFRFHYTVLGQQHSLQLRSSSSPAVVGAVVNGLLLVLPNSISLMTLDFVDFAPTGSDIFNPVVTGFEGNVYGSAAGDPEMAAWAYTFLGRSSGGRRVRIALFGALFLGSDYRIEAAASSEIADAIAELSGAGSILQCIDGLVPVWKTYVDIQVNDHWVKVLRP